MDGEIYRDSRGRYWSSVQLWERLEAGRWRPCFWDPESGEEWVETATGELLALTPVSSRALPDGVEVSSVEEGVLVRNEHP